MIIRVNPKICSAALIFLLAVTSAATAAHREFTWTNAQGDGDWNDPNNWNGIWRYDDGSTTPLSSSILGKGHPWRHEDQFTDWAANAGTLIADGNYVFRVMTPGRNTSETNCEMVIPAGSSVQVLYEIRTTLVNNSFALTLEGSLIVGDPEDNYPLADPNWPGYIYLGAGTNIINMNGAYLCCGGDLAIAAGGPGAMVWLWVTAVLGMALKFTECTLAVKYRDHMPDGSVRGGPMYYIKNGMGKHWKPMAFFFALAAFGVFAKLIKPDNSIIKDRPIWAQIFDVGYPFDRENKILGFQFSWRCRLETRVILEVNTLFNLYGINKPILTDLRHVFSQQGHELVWTLEEVIVIQGLKDLPGHYA